MKKNIVPLLAIAFVVAIVSTGLFYGLFASKLTSNSSNLPRQDVVVAARKLPRGSVLAASDLQVAEIRGSTAFGSSFTKREQVIGSTLLEPVELNQALTKGVLSTGNAGGAGAIPPGMRAITIHVLESGGVLARLHPGSRVDVQAISDRNSAPGELHTALRTIFQNVEVLSTSPQSEQVALRFSAPAVTVLIRAEDSDRLAVADTGARLRLTLRNGLDETVAERAGVAWPFGAPMRVARAASPAVVPAVSSARNIGGPRPSESLLLLARVIAVTEKGAQDISSSTLNPLDRKTLNVTRFRSQADAESLLGLLESHHELNILSSTRLRFDNGRPVAVTIRSGPRLSLAVHAERPAGAGPESNDRILRVQPFVSWPEAHGVATRSLTTELPMPFETGFLISGIQLAPERSADGRQLIVIVTPPSRPVVALAAHALRD